LSMEGRSRSHGAGREMISMQTTAELVDSIADGGENVATHCLMDVETLLIGIQEHSHTKG
jgi:hypothetical protein